MLSLTVDTGTRATVQQLPEPAAACWTGSARRPLLANANVLYRKLQDSCQHGFFSCVVPTITEYE